MADRRRALNASRDGSEKKKASGSDHEQDSDFVEGPKWQESVALKREVKDEPIRKIKVTKLPEETTEEILLNYFENRRRNGGGPIEHIELHLVTSSAIIEFQEADAVDIVLKKRPLLFLRRQISVEEYVEEVEEPPCSTIEVRGLNEVLEMYFENSKQSGGGEVTKVEIKDGVALVTFADEGVASSVCKREHTFGGHKLSVSLHLPKKMSSAVEMEKEEEEAVEPVCTIEVRGYKLGSEGTIEMYFENTKRSGRDEIVKFDPVDSDGVIFITFASEEVARRVAERQHVVAGCTLDVKLYEPPKRKSAQTLSWTTSNEPEECVAHCTIEVRGVTQNILGTLQLYFENRKWSGGDEIVKFEYREENEIAYITYGSEEVAQRVAFHGQHKVQGQSLQVKLHVPPPHRLTYGDRVLLAGLTSKITCDGLTNFFEAKLGRTPIGFLFGEEGDKIIIRFDQIIDFRKLEEACKKRALEGSHLQPSKVQVSNCILVLNLKISTTEDTIESYFENEKQSWGGPVEKVEFHRDKEYCLVYFEDHTICYRVLQRKHKIDGSELQVSMYYECLGRISEDDNGPSFKPPKPLKLEKLEVPILEKLVACNSGMIQLIEKKDNNEVDKIAKDLAHFYVQITIQSKGCFLVRGNQEGINQATYRLQELVNKVKHRDHELKKPGITGYMEGKGRERISAVENQIPCVIQIRGQEGFYGCCDEQAPMKASLKSPEPRRPNEHIPIVWIDIYAWECQNLDAAINKLDHLIRHDFDKNEFTESVIKNFSPDQVSKLQRLAQQWELQLTMDLKTGRITIEGVSEGIMRVSDGIHRLIREADKKEQDKMSAELLKKLVQWHYIEITRESSVLREYPADINLLIETAYKDLKPFVTFFTKYGKEVKIDFSKLEEFSIKDPSNTVTVVRKDLIQEMASFELPCTWSSMAPKENLKVVNLQSTDKEYQDVQKKFIPSVGGNRTILKLERIQNRFLYQQYESKKKLIEQNNPGHQNESSLWHGTSADTVDSISMHGFNRSYCRKNEMAFSELPSTWSKMTPYENLKVVNLQSTDMEYQHVQQKFLQSVGGSRTIVKLERIQNRTLYQQYEAKKKLKEQNNPGHQNESSLWHGTSADSVDSISLYGFNRSFCNKNATAFGDGVYFAKNASYSASDTYSRPDPSGNKKMYQCRVLTGQYTTGRQGMRFPPAKPGGNPYDLYDSVVNNTSNPEIFVIFSDTQAIPEYLFTFK